MEPIISMIKSKTKMLKKNSHKRLFLKGIYQNLKKENHRLAVQWNLQMYHILGDTYLTTAVKIGDVNTTKELLKAGANMDLTDLRGYSPLSNAVLACHQTILKILCEASSKKEGPLNILHLAVSTENAKGMTILLRKWPSLINQKDVNQRTALHDAITKKSPDCVSVLLTYGADITVCLPDGTTLLEMVENICKQPNVFHIFSNLIRIIKTILCYESSIFYETNGSEGFEMLELQFIFSKRHWRYYYLKYQDQHEKVKKKYPLYCSESTKLFLKYKC